MPNLLKTIQKPVFSVMNVLFARTFQPSLLSVSMNICLAFKYQGASGLPGASNIDLLNAKALLKARKYLTKTIWII